MSNALRKKSPRAPSISLDEAIERALRVYEKEKRHAAPTDVVAQDIGYKSANNGAALAVLASLRYFGLLERPEDGKLAVAKDVENYRYAPDEPLRRALLMKWMRTPQVFADLLDGYSGGLPSDATLRFDLINRGFSPVTAESVISVFRKSVEFSGYFAHQPTRPQEPDADPLSNNEPVVVVSPLKSESPPSARAISASTPEWESEEIDKIPVRLTGGRRAWLVIPSPFYEADKQRLKAQIDLLLTEDM